MYGRAYEHLEQSICPTTPEGIRELRRICFDRRFGVRHRNLTLRRGRRQNKGCARSDGVDCRSAKYYLVPEMLPCLASCLHRSGYSCY